MTVSLPFVLSSQLFSRQNPQYWLVCQFTLCLSAQLFSRQNPNIDSLSVNPLCICPIIFKVEPQYSQEISHIFTLFFLKIFINPTYLPKYNLDEEQQQYIFSFKIKLFITFVTMKGLTHTHRHTHSYTQIDNYIHMYR